MYSIQSTEETRQLIDEVANLRTPAETVLLLGGGGCGNTQAQLVDRNLVNNYVDIYLGQVTEAVKVYSSGGTEKFFQGSQISLDVERVKPNFCSDSFSLEAQLGYRILCTIERAIPLTRSSEILNV